MTKASPWRGESTEAPSVGQFFQLFSLKPLNKYLCGGWSYVSSLARHGAKVVEHMSNVRLLFKLAD